MKEQVLTAQSEEEETKKVYVDKRTPAQMAFDKIQERRVCVPFSGYFTHQTAVQGENSTKPRDTYLAELRVVVLKFHLKGLFKHVKFIQVLCSFPVDHR